MIGLGFPRGSAWYVDSPEVPIRGNLAGDIEFDSTV